MRCITQESVLTKLQEGVIDIMPCSGRFSPFNWKSGNLGSSPGYKLWLWHWASHVIFPEFRFLTWKMRELSQIMFFEALEVLWYKFKQLHFFFTNWAPRQDIIGRKGTLAKKTLKTLAMWISRFYWSKYLDNKLLIPFWVLTPGWFSKCWISGMTLASSNWKRGQWTRTNWLDIGSALVRSWVFQREWGCDFDSTGIQNSFHCCCSGCRPA